VIIVHNEPGILGQTQRRRRYPKRQQRHCYDCFQPMHGKQKYSAPLEIFKQFLKAINAPLRLKRRTQPQLDYVLPLPARQILRDRIAVTS
jgi:hypothetical protein